MTISQIRALGDRLRGKATPRPGDLELLQQLRADHDPPLQFAETVLRERLGISATSRLKTVQTLIEKLVREKTRLSAMQDIAGLRIVDDLTLDEQDALVSRIESAFEKTTRDDRRAKPSYGYRAVHVIAEIDECPVEIQIRTRLQDLWAQAMESLADLWGRQIRYGLPPDGELELLDPNDQSGPTRTEVVATLIRTSPNIARLEAAPDPQQHEALRVTLEGFVRAFTAVRLAK